MRSLEDPDRYLKALLAKLVPRLQAEVGALSRAYPGLGFRVWGHAYGPPDRHQRFGAGIASESFSLVIDVVDLRFLPSVNVHLRSATGGLSWEGIRDKPLGALRGLPAMFKLFRDALARPGEGEEIRFFPWRLPCSMVPCPGSELEVYRAAYGYLRETRDLGVAVVDDRAVGQQGQGPSWAAAAYPFFCQDLADLREDTFVDFHREGQKDSLLSEIPGLPCFHPIDRRPELVWCDYYLRHPGAPGKLQFTRPGWSQSGDQALLAVTLAYGEEEQSATVERPYRPGDPFTLLLLLEKGDGWRVIAERNLERALPSEIEERLRLERLRGWFSKPEMAGCLGLDSIELEAVKRYADSDGRYDLKLIRAERYRKVAVVARGWASSQAHDEVYIIDRPVALVTRLDGPVAMNALLELMNQWEEGPTPR